MTILPEIALAGATAAVVRALRIMATCAPTSLRLPQPGREKLGRPARASPPRTARNAGSRRLTRARPHDCFAGTLTLVTRSSPIPMAPQ